MEGRCQCGQIQFKTPLPEPVIIYICHCTECRHQSSSAFGVTARFPWFELPVTDPEHVKTYSRRGLSGRTTHCLFCSRCGSRLIHRRDGEELLSVKGGCLDKLSIANAVHIWCQEAIVPIPAGARSFPQEPLRNEESRGNEPLKTQ